MRLQLAMACCSIGSLGEVLPRNGIGSGAEVAGEGLFDDDVFAAAQGIDSKLLMGRWRTAQVDDVGGIAEGFEGVEGGDGGFAGEGFAVLGRARGHAGDLDRDGMDAAQVESVEASGEACANDADANGGCHVWTDSVCDSHSLCTRGRWAQVLKDGSRGQQDFLQWAGSLTRYWWRDKVWPAY